MNTGNFAGYLGKDAVLKATPSGQMVLNFSIGVSVGFGDNQRTLWVSCALWGDRAEKLEQYLTKGKPVAVSGDVDMRTYETRDGRSGAELLLNVQRLTLLGKKDSEQAAPREERPASTSSPRREPRQSEDMWGADHAASKKAQPATAAAQGGDDFDDDIPF